MGSHAAGDGADRPDALGRWRAHRLARDRRVVAEGGPLSLERTRWIDGEEAVAISGVPGLWRRRTDGLPGLEVHADRTDGLEVDGETVDGTARLFGMSAMTPSTIRLADGRRVTIVDGDERAAVRIWNGAAEAIGRFGGIETYPHDPALVVRARVTRHAGAAIAIEHVRDEGRLVDEPLVAEFEFDLAGGTHRFAGIADSAGALITFADATTGRDTYGVGRFLMVDASLPVVELDFNLAYLPPCAFSIGFNCPVPPPQNRLPFPIEAGERRALDRDGTVFEPGGVFA